jgi:hypothetical protein
MAGSVLCGLCADLAFDVPVSIAQIRPTMINDRILLRKVNATKFKKLTVYSARIPASFSPKLALQRITLHRHTRHTRQLLHPPLLVFINPTFNNTLIARIRLLSLQPSTTCTHASLRLIHSFLQRIVLPAKHIVAVLSVPSVVAHAEVEGLRAIGRPVGFVVEVAGVPHNLFLLLV